ncbi:hypothetical protein [Sphingomonas elodea]|uniref:hypothetical protein n=1 Tax=Sphingomonas elodea TaxID=179878 RepID=UPI001300C814|nr:hypothetical protein [Sphingomonas elodea]
MASEISYFASGIVLTAFSAVLPLAASAQSVTQYSYDAQGRLIGTQQGEGVTSDYTMDPASNRTRVRVTPQFPTAWSATSSAIGHIVGRAEGSAWSASVYDPVGAMVYGPYTTGVSAGSHVAAFRMLVDNNNADNSAVVILDVWDATASAELAVRTITRTEWKAAFAYQVFELPFTLSASSVGHALEFRVAYQKTSYVRVDKVGYR